MKRLFAIFILIIISLAGVSQPRDSVFLYRRGSICSFMIGHRNLSFAQEIEKAFDEMPVPNRYNDHGLGKKVFYTGENKLKMKGLDEHRGFRVNSESDKKEMNDYDFFLQKHYIASRLVAKWFMRKKDSGICSMSLIQNRGYENASALERRIAERSVRKEALLQDAGEELIGSTFVLINDIRYIDRSKGSSVLGGIVSAGIKVAGALNGIDVGEKDLGTLIASYKGFNVIIKTYLYQLVWDDEISNFFYKDVYTEQLDENKRENFENGRGKFSLVYLGMQKSSGATVSFMGINENEPQKMVRKACQRALDENIANLQKNFDVFKTMAILSNVEPLQSEIGMKEGITEDSRYEVLEKNEMADGHIEYKRIGVVRPVAGKIWDNRYMAKEENANGADFGYTTFEKVSGKDFAKGMLLREMSEK